MQLAFHINKKQTNNKRTSTLKAAATGLLLLALGGLNIAGPRTGNAQVYSWGSSSNGQLGNGTLTDSSTYVQVTGLTGAISIMGGAHQCAALKSDGTVSTWGQNNFGQLGNGTTTDSNIPVAVTGLTGVTAIAGRGYHDLALKAGGVVWAWGSNSNGQIGDGTTTDRSTPVQVPGLTGVEAIATGEMHSLALKSDGTVWAWGSNSNGQLGDGTTTDNSAPAQVPGLTGVTAIACEGSSSLALKSDGTVWAWGWNTHGELGIGNTTDSSVPVQVPGLGGVVAIAAGWRNGMALMPDGTIREWGYNENGSVGDGTISTGVHSPVQVTGLSGVTAIAGGWQQSMALLSNGTVWDWGYNAAGELGNGSTTDSSIPVQVTGLTGVVAITGGQQTSHALVSVPAIPTSLTATAGDAQVTLSWTASIWAASYNVKRSTVNGSGYATVANPGTTSYTNTGLTNGTTYYYVVTGVDSDGESPNSNQASATPEPPAPGTPTGFTATAGDMQITLAWTASSGATAYRLRRSTVNGSGYVNIATPLTASYLDTGLTNGTTYYYVVAAQNGGGESLNSSQASATPEPPIPGAPTGLTATAGDTKVTLAWTAASGATAYHVKRSTVNGSGYATITSPTSASYTDTGLTNGTAYYYVVSAVNGGGESGNSSQASATPEPPVPGAPTGLVATPGNAQVVLAWTAASGATGYHVKRSTVNGSGYATIFSPPTAGYTNTGLTNGTTYYYVVTAVNGGGESGNSSQASATPEPPVPAAPTGLTATQADTQVALAWTASSGATGYNVKRSTVSGGPYATVASPTAASYSDTGLTDGTTYFYVVSAINGGGESADSSQAYATPEPADYGTPTANLINLTTLGTSDWAHWGLTAQPSFEHKTSGAGKISNWTQVGTVAPLSFSSCAVAYTWTDGTTVGPPNGTATAPSNGTTTGVYVTGVGNGFSFTAPADTTMRTLTVYVGGWHATGTLTAHLSDGSAPDYTTQVTNLNSVFDQTITMRYAAASANKTMTVTWKMTADGGMGNVTLEAATLAVGAVGPNFNVLPYPVSLSSARQSSGATTIYVTPYNGLAGNVALSTSGLPSGVTASFGPYSAANASVMTVNVDSTVAPGTYPFNVVGTSSGVTHSAPATLTVTPGALIGSAGGASTVNPINLTTLGTTDWAHWGLNGVTNFDHKASGGSKIGNWASVGTGTPGSFSSCAVGYSWTDGTPTASASASTTGIYVNGVNSGFSFTTPADTTIRTLTVYVGGYQAAGTLTAHLTDSGAPDYTGTAANMSGIFNEVFTITYAAASASQNLVITWKETAGTTGNVTLEAATLATGTPSPDFNLSASPANLSIAQGVGSPAAVTVTPYNGFTSGVTLSASGLPSGVTAAFSANPATASSTLTFTVAASAALGTYPITITATSGSLSHAATVNLTVTAAPVLTTITVTPASASVGALATRQFTAVAKDQNGAPLAAQPTFTWTVSGGGTISTAGLFTAGSTIGGPYTVTAKSGSVSGTASVSVVAIPDFNADGRADLLLQDSVSNKAAVWGLTGATVSSPVYVSFTPPAGFNVVSAGDFNSDGKPDLVLENTSTNQIAVWTMNGATLVSGAYVDVALPSGWKVVCSGDFDGDGKRDLILQETSTGKVAIWYLSGTHLVSGAYPSPAPALGWIVVGCGDFNGDGKLDLVLQNSTTNAVMVDYLNGTTVTGSANISSTPSSGWTVAGTADFDGDGTTDLVLQNASTKQIALWYLNGVTFSSSVNVNLAIPTGWSVVGPR